MIIRVLIFIFFFLSQITFSQSKHHIGLGADLSFTKMTSYYTNTPYDKIFLPYKSGFAINGIYDFSFHENFGIQSGLGYYYQKRKSRAENSNDFVFIANNTVQETTLYLHSLKIPALVYYNFNLDKYQLKLLIGMAYLIHLDGRYTQQRLETQTTSVFPSTQNTTSSYEEGEILFQKIPSQTQNKTMYHKNGNLCMNVGFEIVKDPFSFSFKYSYGIVNQYAVPKNPNTNIIPDRYNTSDLSLGFAYYLKTKSPH